MAKTHIVKQLKRAFTLCTWVTLCGHIVAGTTPEGKKVTLTMKQTQRGLQDYGVPNRVVPPRLAKTVPKKERCKRCFTSAA